jgi:hypothetical protein
VAGRVLVLAGARGGLVPCAGVQGALGDLVQRRPGWAVVAGGRLDGLVGEQVSAGTAGGVVFGCGEKKLAGGVEGVGVPAGGEHALAEDQVGVLALADTEADPHVHHRAQRALAHGFLGEDPLDPDPGTAAPVSPPRKCQHQPSPGEQAQQQRVPRAGGCRGGAVKLTLIMIYFAKATTKCSGHTRQTVAHFVVALAK